MHIVISYRAGLLQCYVKVNGKSVLTKSDELQGDFSNWEAMTLILGDEVNGDRDWKGSIERLAIRSRFLDGDEAARQFELLE
jgi:hypothetical protein